MCIIVVKPKKEVLPESVFKNCFVNNPDGCGFMYARNGVVHGKKGIMSYEEFKKENAKIPKDVDVIYHFRIQTHGGVVKELTHPFKLSNDFEALHKLSWKGAYGIAHNGIFSKVTTPEKESDTEIFITNILYPLYELSAFKENSLLDKYYDDIIENAVGTSRLAIMDGDGNYKLYGSGWVNAYGCHFSNSSYSYDNSYIQYYPYKSAKSNTTYNNKHWFDEDDYSYDSCFDYSYKNDDETSTISSNADTSTIKVNYISNPDNIVYKFPKGTNRVVGYVPYGNSCQYFDKNGDMYYWSDFYQSFIKTSMYVCKEAYDKDDEFALEVVDV